MSMKVDYVWKGLYEAAILETDYGKLTQRIHAAKGAIDDRLHELMLDHGGTPEERQAISDALFVLNVLGQEVERRSNDAGSSHA
jgi:hypothetical protein